MISSELPWLLQGWGENSTKTQVFKGHFWVQFQISQEQMEGAITAKTKDC